MGDGQRQRHIWCSPTSTCSSNREGHKDTRIPSLSHTTRSAFPRILPPNMATSSSRISYSTIFGTVAATVAASGLAYAVYFDYMRRNNVERLAFSVIWELTQDAEIVNVRFTKSVIASKEAFTYEATQKRKDDPSLNDPLTEGIRLLNSIAIKLRAGRMAAGALNLASPEVKIHQDSSETTGPIDVEQKQLLETNSLVEEFMLLANISVAQKIYDTFPQTAVLRRHLP